MTWVIWYLIFGVLVWVLFMARVMEPGEGSWFNKEGLVMLFIALLFWPILLMVATA